MTIPLTVKILPRASISIERSQNATAAATWEVEIASKLMPSVLYIDDMDPTAEFPQQLTLVLHRSPTRVVPSWTSKNGKLCGI